MIIACVYNTIIGYLDTVYFLLIYAFLNNRPKGTGYLIAESEANLNIFIGVIMIISYLLILVPLNYLFFRKARISKKSYGIICVTTTIVGIRFFWTN